MQACGGPRTRVVFDARQYAPAARQLATVTCVTILPSCRTPGQPADSGYPAKSKNVTSGVAWRRGQRSNLGYSCTSPGTRADTPRKRRDFGGGPRCCSAAAWLPCRRLGDCLADPDPEIHRLQELIGQDATQAPQRGQECLESPRSARRSADPRRPPARRVAHRGPVRGRGARHTASWNSTRRRARAAEKGLALAPSDPRSGAPGTAIGYTGSVYDNAGHRRRDTDHRGARERCSRAARRPIPACSSPAGCWSIGQGREDLAIVTLTQAYRASERRTAATEVHIMSADYLSLVMRSMGDYSQALALNQEKIDWDTAHDADHEPVRVAIHARPDPQADGRLRRGDRRIQQGPQAERIAGRSRRASPSPISASARRTSSSASSRRHSANARTRSAPSVRPIRRLR